MKIVFSIIALISPFSVHGIDLDEYTRQPFGQILFLRHALAPGFGDPEHFQLRQSETQRNLNEEVRQQAKNIGSMLKGAKLKFDAIYSSQWCRCLETAKLL